MAIMVLSVGSAPATAVEPGRQPSVARAAALDSRLWLTEFGASAEAARPKQDEIEMRQLPMSSVAVEWSPADTSAADIGMADTASADTPTIAIEVPPAMSDWERASVQSGPGSGSPAQSGPTLTTVLVAMAATVVLVGSLLSPK